jgi:hypothetical protein
MKPLFVNTSVAAQKPPLARRPLINMIQTVQSAAQGLKPAVLLDIVRHG